MKKLIVIVFILLSTFTYSQNCTVNADIDQTVCSNTTVNLTGSVAGLPNLPVVTTWSQVSGPSAIITNPNSLLTTVTGLIGGSTYVFRFSSSCTDGSLVYDDMQVVVNKITIANAGPDFSPICPNASALERKLAGNAVGTGETGLWTVVSGTGLTITTPSSPTSAFTMNSTPGNSVLRWTITNSTTGCTSFDEVIIPKMGGTTVSAGNDQTLGACYTPPFTSYVLQGSLAGNGIGGQIGTWSVVSGPSVPNFANPNINNTTVSNLKAGVYVFRWTVVGSCFNGSDDVQITVPAGIGAATSATASISGSPAMPFCDGRNNVVLVGNTPKVGETGIWTQITPATPLATIGSPNSPITTVTGLNSSYSYRFRYTISNTSSGCSSAANVDISYGTTPDVNITTAKPFVGACGVTSASIAFTQSGTGTVQYSIVSGPITTTFPTIPSAWANAGNSPLVLNGLNNGGTYLVRFRKQSGTGSTCSTDYDEITLLMSKAPSLASAGSNQLFACSVFSGSLNANIPAPSTGFGKWSQVSGPNTASITNPLDPKSLVSGLTNGNYVFRWLISNGDQCATNQADVVVGVASIVPTSAQAGADRTVCYNSPLILDGNAPVLNETGTWSVIPSTGLTFSNINSKNAIVNGMSPNTVYTFKWTISNACGSTNDEVIITSNNTLGPIASLAGPDQCLSSGTTSLTLAANDPSPGTGLWTKIQGPSATITNPSLNTSTVTGLTDGTYYFEWAITRNACTLTRDTVVITISKPTTIAAAGSDQIICGTSTILSANNASSGTTSGVGTWTVESGSGGVTFANVNSPTTTVSNLTSGVYTFRWTITNGVCSSNFDEVKLFVSTPPLAALAGPDQFKCGVTTATMAANTPLAGQGTGYWSIVSGPGSPTITSLNSPTTTITGLTTGVYTFSWNIQNGPYCAVSSDNVVVEVVPNANAGADLSYCDATSANLFGNPSTTGTWTQIGTTPNVATITPTTPSTATVSGLIAGTYTFRYTINTVGCTTFDDMNVVISGAPTIANAGTDKDFCNVTSWTMNANTPIVGTGSWVRFSGPNSPTLSSTTSPTATITGAIAGTYVYEWRISSGTCTSVDRVHITISNLDAMANAGPDQLHVCGPIANLNATAPTNGVGTWSQVSGPNTAIFSSSILNNANATGLIAGTYVFRWTLSNGVCSPVSDDVSITVFDNPTTPNAGSDQNLCGNTSTTLAGNTIALGTGTWTKESGPACNITSINSPNSTVTNLSPGTYVFRWTSVLVNCSLFDEVTVKVFANPSTANAGSDFSSCLYSNLNLAATVPAVGTGGWTQIAGSTVNILNPTSPTTSIIGALTGSYTFRWTVSNGVCTSSSDDVTVNIDNITTQPIAGPNQNMCNVSQFTMAGNTIASGTGTWTRISGPNTPVITNPNLPNTTITGTILGTYIFRWTATNGSCSMFDEVTINNAGINTPPNAGPDQLVCSVSTTMAANVITVGVGSWSKISGPAGVVITDTSSPTTTITGLVLGSYVFRWTSSNGACSTFDDVIINKNCPPIATDDNASTNEDVPVTTTLSILSNDTDTDHTLLTNKIDLDPNTPGIQTTFNNVYGNWSVNSTTGRVTYTPARNFNGIAVLTYEICDGGMPILCDQANVIVTVNPINDPPIAINDVNTTFVNTSVDGQILTNDSDPEGNPLTVTTTPIISPAHGTVVINANGTYTYTPTTGYVGEDSFTYRICDNQGLCDDAVVTIEVMPKPNAANDPPVAVNDAYTAQMNSTVTGAILANDFDVDNQPITVISALVATGSDGVPNDALTLGSATTVYGTNSAGVVVVAGTLTLNSNGLFTFVPSNGFVGNVTYSYLISDGTLTDDATVTIEVLPSFYNNTVYALNDAAQTTKNVAVNGNVLTNDYDPEGNIMTVTPQTAVTTANGTVTINTNGTYTYTPNNGFVGEDTFNYTVCDNGVPQACDVATVTIVVAPEQTTNNDPPVAVNDTYFSPLNTSLSKNIITNDFDIDGNALTVISALVATGSDGLVNDPLTLGTSTSVYGINASGAIVIAGTLTLNSTGIFTFIPTVNFAGTVNYSYTISDGNGGTDTANVTIDIIPSTNTTFATDDAFIGPANGSINGNLKANDYDPQGHTQSISIIPTIPPAHGILVINPNGTFTYTPNNNYVGTDQFVYETCDNGSPQACDKATVYLNVYATTKSCLISNRNVTPKIIK